MDFLPKDQKDLQLSSYWKQFFEFDRFKEGFEWYASFEDLIPYLRLFITDKHDQKRVVVPGCGNSDLSLKLCTKLGVDGVTVDSFDYEEQVVKKMQESVTPDLKDKLKFSFGDCTDLSKNYKDQAFDFAVDKGTLDAIAVDNEKETISKCWAYFNEMVRVLDNDHGVLMIVSLLQPHVLKIILDFFVLENEQNKYQKSNLFQVKAFRIEHIEGYAEK